MDATKYWFNKYFDFKMSGMGAIGMAFVVFLINIEYGFYTALEVSLKQGVYTFFIGGFVVKMCEYIACYFKAAVLSVILSVVIPSLITISATYAVHVFKLLRDTPDPFISTLPTIIAAPICFFVWGIIKRRKISIL